MPKLTDEQKKNKKKCIGECGKELIVSVNFYKSNSVMSDGRTPMCKKCIANLVDCNNIQSVYNVLEQLDIKFDYLYWQKAVDSPKDTFGTYMAMANSLRQFDRKGFKDSNYKPNNKNKNRSEELEDDISDEEDYITSTETIKYWGKGYESWEYEFLEEQKKNVMSSFECPDYGMEMIMKDICFINLDIEKIRQEKKPNGHGDITKLITARSSLMNSANMNPIQSTGAEAGDQMVFGVMIKKWENDKPVPKSMDDEMKEYIDTYMVGHLAKMEGLTNEMTEKYDALLSEYTIDFEEIAKIEAEDDE